MGFGLLSIGYLATFLLPITLANFGLSYLATLFGSVLMFFALKTLKDYERQFTLGYCLTVVFFALGIFEIFKTYLPAIKDNETLGNIYSWVYFGLVILMHWCLLFPARNLASKVELPSLAKSLYIGDVLVLSYVIAYLFPIDYPIELTIFVLMTLYLFVSFIRCAKNIAPADEKPLPQKGFFAKLDRELDKREQEAVLKTLREREEYQKKKKK